MRSSLCTLTLMVAGLGMAWGMPVGRSAEKPNILLLLSDDHSYPFLSCYGDKNVRTPTLDGLAAEGMKLHRFFTAAPQCVPSRAALMTGRSPVAARITRFSSPLSREEITFPELLREKAGYFVGVCGRSYHLDGSNRTGESTARVFEVNRLRTFRDRMDFVMTGSDTQVAVQAAEFLDKRPPGKPFFLWANFSDPHHVWNAPDEFRPDPASLTLPAHWPDLPGMREQLADYCGEVNRLDRSVKSVLDVLAARGVLDNTLIVFTADNGAALPHGKGSLYDPGSNVPMVVRWPGHVKPGSESSSLLSGEDLAPTLLEAAGIAPHSKMSGASFLPLLTGQSYRPRRHLFVERGPHGSAPVSVGMSNSGYDLSRAVRSDRYKFIYNCTPWIPYGPVDSAGGAAWTQIKAAQVEGKLAPGVSATYFTAPRPVYELYDLQNDPSELSNISGKPEYASVELELREALAEKMILDFDYLPLPELGSAPAPAGKTRRAARNQDSAQQQQKKVSKKSPIHVLFCIADDASPHFGAYGCTWARTPHIDQVAREGLLFRNAYTPTAKCAPSRAAILTGRNPWQLEEAANHQCYFPANYRAFTEALRDAGVHVGAQGKTWGPGSATTADGKPRDFGMARSPGNDAHPGDGFRKFLAERQDGQPFFYWFGSKNPHRAYRPDSGLAAGKKPSDIDRVPAFWPDNEVVRRDMLDYAVEIESYDTQVGSLLRVLQESGEAENTVVIVTSDHGMPFPRVKGHNYDMANRVPLIVRWPAGVADAGRSVDELITFIDLAPTILELFGVDGQRAGMAAITGGSFTDLLRGKPARPREFVILGRERNDVLARPGSPAGLGYPVRGIRQGDLLYLRNFEPDRWPCGNPELGLKDTDASPTKQWIEEHGANDSYWQYCYGKRPAEELFDLASDPDCAKNLAEEKNHQAVKASLRGKLLAELKRQQDPRVSGQGAVFDNYPTAKGAAAVPRAPAKGIRGSKMGVTRGSSARAS